MRAVKNGPSRRRARRQTGLTLHELEHDAIGLGHPTEGRGDVMFVGANCFDFINRYPSADDIAGAHVVYGVPEPGTGLVLLTVGVGLAGRRRAMRGSST